PVCYFPFHVRYDPSSKPTQQIACLKNTIFIYILVFGALFSSSYLLHSFVLEINGVDLPFSLLDAYIFHFIFSFCICLFFKIASHKPKLFEQLGYIYLVSVLIKLFCFTALYKNSLFGDQVISTFESFQLLLPLFVFLPV